MKRQRFLIVCACAALIACGKDAKDKGGEGGGGGDTASAVPAKASWQLDDFLVTFEAPKGWQFWELDADFDKVTYASGDGDFAESTLTLSGTCGGSCQADKFPANIAEASQEAFKFLENATWEKPLTEVKPGVWAYRIRGKGMRGDKVQINVSHIDARVDDQFLSCSGELTGDSIGQADAIEKLCTELSFDVKPSDAPIEAVFGGKYTLEEFTLEVPTPPDWKFSAYSVQWGRVSFKRGFGTKVEVGATCGGRCKEELFAGNIKGEADQDFESMGNDGEASWVKEFSEVSPGTYLHRVRRTKDGNVDEERIKVAAVRKGAEHYFYCRADLGKDDVGLGDAMEKYCLDRAAAALK